jgi:hypothetical protein
MGMFSFRLFPIREGTENVIRVQQRQQNADGTTSHYRTFVRGFLEQKQGLLTRTRDRVSACQPALTLIDATINFEPLPRLPATPTMIK